GTDVVVTNDGLERASRANTKKMTTRIAIIERTTRLERKIMIESGFMQHLKEGVSHLRLSTRRPKVIISLWQFAVASRQSLSEQVVDGQVHFATQPYVGCDRVGNRGGRGHTFGIRRLLTKSTGGRP